MILRGEDEEDDDGWSLADDAPRENKIRMVYQGQPPQNGFYGPAPQCTYCAKFGHTIERCQKRRRDNHEPVEPDWECRICHRRGVHYTADCPERLNRSNGDNNGNGGMNNGRMNGATPNQQTQGARDDYNRAPPPNGAGQPAYREGATTNGASNTALQSAPTNLPANRAGPRGGCFTCQGPHFERDCPQKRVAANTSNRGGIRPPNDGGYPPVQTTNQGNYRRP